MGFNNGLRVISLACLVTLAGVCVQPASVAAADPSASPTPTADPSASPTPTADPSATPAPTPATEPSATPTSDPSATPAPTADPSATPAPTPAVDPSATPTSDPSASPAPTADPSITPAPTADPSATPAPTPAVGTALVVPPPVAVKPNNGARVVRIALAQRGKRYVRGAAGPRAFDCSGLVRYSYLRAGVLQHLGGGHSARGMYYWARIHGRAGRSNPRAGDVVIYGNGSHAGIYVGNGRVISALNTRLGIRVTGLHGLTVSFTTYIHTKI